MTRALLVLALWLAPLMAAAQAREGAATLVADTLTVTRDGLLIAEGGVEAFYEGTALTASALTFDREAGVLTLAGPILIRDATGAILAADAASLDPQLRDGILRGARLVLDRRLQLAAARVDRVDGRYTALTGAAATSCQVCEGVPPLWEIQADRVVHDTVARQITFDGARFRIRGVPVFWLPWLRLPDPTNTRSAGLLIPQVRTSNRLGAGIRLPVFVPLGPSRDVTVTPWLSRRTRTLEVQVRQAFARGEIGLRGALSDDGLQPDGLRGFALVRGRLDVAFGATLSFDGLVVSDDAYLADYDLSDDDRLESTVALERVGTDSRLLADVTITRSVREDEVNGLLPPVEARLAWDRRVTALGGTLSLGAGADAFVRTAGGDAGRDVARAGVSAAWRRDWLLGAGVLAEAEGRLALDAYRIADDPDRPAALGRAQPAAAVTLRWPLARRGPGGSDLIEPVVSLGWARALGDTPPNEDARLPELDESNLHALTRLPGEDGEEAGARLSWGVAWTRQGAGMASTLMVGRIVRADGLDVSDTSGLSGLTSDTLVAGAFDLGDGVMLRARALVDGPLAEAAFGKGEARLDWAGEAVTASAGYIHLPADLDEDRPRSAAEWTVAAEVRPSDRWTIRAGGRYDVGRDRPARASFGLGWRNECVEVDATISRRYTSTDSIEPSTSFGLTINLDGFSAGGRASVAPSSCRR